MKNATKYAFAALLALPIIGWSASIIGGEVDGGKGGVATTFFVPGATVTLVSGSGGNATPIASTVTDDHGQYSFSNVPSGFIQVVVQADGYTPNPASVPLAVNADTSLVANFVLTTSGSQTIAGSSSIGGQVSSTSGALTGVQVTLRRRATNTGAYVVVDSTLTDGFGSYLFSNIAAAGATLDINAYSLVVNAGGYNSFTSGNITVADNATALSNISLTPTALSPAFASKTQGIRFIKLNGQLALDVGVSSVTRILEVSDLTGAVQKRVSIPANSSRVMLSAAFAPEKGFLFRFK